MLLKSRESISLSQQSLGPVLEVFQNDKNASLAIHR
jgi:hypothetical protein